MPSLLFGPEPRRLERGEFFCHECGGSRAYQRVVVRRALRLFGRPVLPAGRYGEYVECLSCLSTYRPEVLAYDAGDRSRAVMSEYQRAMRRVLALLAVSDGEVQESEVDAVRRVYEAVTGQRLARRDILDETAETSARPTTAASYLARVAGHLNDYGKEQILRAAALVSHADGRLDAREAEVIWRLGAVMRLERSRIETVLAELAGGAARDRA